MKVERITVERIWCVNLVLNVVSIITTLKCSGVVVKFLYQYKISVHALILIHLHVPTHRMPTNIVRQANKHLNFADYVNY